MRDNLIYVGYDASRQGTIFRHQDTLRICVDSEDNSRVNSVLDSLPLVEISPMPHVLSPWIYTLTYSEQIWDILLSISKSGEHDARIHL